MTIGDILTNIETVIATKNEAKHGSALRVVKSPFWLAQAPRDWHGSVYVITADEGIPGGEISGGLEEESTFIEVHVGWEAGQRASVEVPKSRLTARRVRTAIETAAGWPARHKSIFYREGRREQPIAGTPQLWDLVLRFEATYDETYPEDE